MTGTTFRRAVCKAIKKTDDIMESRTAARTTAGKKLSLLELNGPDGRHLRIDTNMILHLFDDKGMEVWTTDLKEMVGISKKQ